MCPRGISPAEPSSGTPSVHPERERPTRARNRGAGSVARVQLPAAAKVREPLQRQEEGKVARNSGEEGSRSATSGSCAKLHDPALYWPSEEPEGPFWRRGATNGAAAAPGGERLRSSPAAGQLSTSRAPPRLRPGTASGTALPPGRSPPRGLPLGGGARRAPRQTRLFVTRGGAGELTGFLEFYDLHMFCIKSQNKLENLNPNSENVNGINSTICCHIAGWSFHKFLNNITQEQIKYIKQ